MVLELGSTLPLLKWSGLQAINDSAEHCGSICSSYLHEDINSPVSGLVCPFASSQERRPPFACLFAGPQIRDPLNLNGAGCICGATDKRPIKSYWCWLHSRGHWRKDPCKSHWCWWPGCGYGWYTYPWYLAGLDQVMWPIPQSAETNKSLKKISPLTKLLDKQPPGSHGHCPSSSTNHRTDIFDFNKYFDW